MSHGLIYIYVFFLYNESVSIHSYHKLTIIQSERKNHMKKLLSLLLTALFLVSCGTATSETTAAETETTAETVPEETKLSANIPDVSYDGYTFTYLTGDPYVSHFRLITDLTGEPLSDAAFNRNLAVSDLLGVEFEGSQIDLGQIASTLQNAVAAGDAAYDVILPHATAGVAAMVTGGMLYNLFDLPVADYEKPWWNDNMMNALAVGDTAYYTSGDIVMTWQGMLAILFNKEYLTNYNIDEDLYQLVRDGKWTYDKMLSLVSGIGMDLDGDGAMTAADQFGMLGNKGTGYGTVIGCGQPLTTRDANGYPLLALNTERMISIVEKYYQMVNLPDTWMDAYSSVSYATSTYRSILIEGRSFLTELDIGGLYSYLREIEFDFGILPLPKFDEAQANHQIFCGAGLIGVPVNLPNAERTGAILEALAYYSYELIRPAFFDVVLENKAVRDADSYEMITLMHENKTFDFGFNFDSTGKCYGMLTEVVINKKSTDFASYYASVESSITSSFEQFIADFEANS